MTEVYTFSFIKKLLDNVNEKNKLKWEDFLKIFLYINIKHKNMQLLSKKKILLIENKSILLEILTKLDMIVRENYIENEETRRAIVNLMNQIREKGVV